MPHCHSFIANLRQHGHRITPQREMIIETLAHSGEHLTVEDIFTSVQARSRTVNLATVYRTVELLVSVGLATQNDLGGGCIVYATCHHGPHVHLVCRGCGCVMDGDPQVIDALNEQLLAHYEFSADLKHLSVSGLCAACKKLAGG